ncbi:YdcF family protein [Gelidibacter gilvus]|uniref:YdcF family protein n=1 Tax=Gelidibacter gilvus TaxID=59602 RepID=A0A4Q0XEA9_9FLAO|nr:YdcF family protein [Gelidibacter gilvus]RXJ45750.1 YdcF family protein [Gelidibacter gilvus]
MLFCFLNIQAQTKMDYDAIFKASQSHDIIQDKNFYLFTAIQNNPKVTELLEANPVFMSLLKSTNEEIESSLKHCKDSSACLVKAYSISEKDITKIGIELEHSLKNSSSLRRLVTDNLRPSGKYENFKELSDEKYLSACWKLCADGMNRIINVYGLGEAPQYKTIDSISYDVSTDFYRGALWMWSDMLQHKRPSKNALFYQPSLDFSLSLLYMNHRDEAARYEPLKLKENRKPRTEINSINFKDYDYPVILILGNGPENYRDTLSALGKLNLKLGALEFQQKKAPLIIVSGGHAHPFRTPIAEALQMKKELIKRYHIPEERIIVEPYARHTTTNLRNATRLMLVYNVPIDRPSLVVTNSMHSQYVGADRFLERCQEELGYLPAIIKKRLSSTTLEFQPKIESLQQNPLDPLDP